VEGDEEIRAALNALPGWPQTWANVRFLGAAPGFWDLDTDGQLQTLLLAFREMRGTPDAERWARFSLGELARWRRSALVTTFLFWSAQSVIAPYSSVTCNAGAARGDTWRVAGAVIESHAGWAEKVGVAAAERFNMAHLNEGRPAKLPAGDWLALAEGKIGVTELMERERKKLELASNRKLDRLPDTERRKVMEKVRRLEKKLGRRLRER
jgi:hypothetical protein